MRWCQVGERSILTSSLFIGMEFRPPDILSLKTRSLPVDTASPLRWCARVLARTRWLTHAGGSAG